MNTGQTRISNRFQLDKDTNRTETLHNAANFNEFLDARATARATATADPVRDDNKKVKSKSEIQESLHSAALRSR